MWNWNSLSFRDYGVMNSKRISSFTELYLSPLRLLRGTARIPLLSSEIGRHVWPPKSSFSDMSYSCTSIRSRANSGTVRGNSNSSFQEGTQLSSKVFVFFITESAGTPAIPIWGQINQISGRTISFFTLIQFSVGGIARCKTLLASKRYHSISTYPCIKVWRRICIKMCVMKIVIPSFPHIHSYLSKTRTRNHNYRLR